ncbi:diacylglycerol/lipid kinase family protein [Pacificimonas flava]|uniref:DAGKc domain-containing protein n=1 Tax=Pacificimonas flava TaxID=1234595 RepID=M2U2R3_9SPHN|nr:diacylglycerol kinase family protein [Pacificimonas flava]EMD82257.1 hypothetical protein C725_2295 [Pacificimonas flava]MBB5280834.1 hypothetical protein [Pacificimonas flava]
MGRFGPAVPGGADGAVSERRAAEAALDKSLREADDHARKAAASGQARTAPRVGIISNPRSHRNKSGARPKLEIERGALLATPATREALAEAMLHFARHGVDLLIVDGGDGTLRDVMTAALPAFGGVLPAMAILPSGKTNAFAIDLGIPLDWTVADAVKSVRAGRTRGRAPLEIHRHERGAKPLRGFLFGAGAFVRATALAQRTHRIGAFNGLAVGMSLVWAIGQTFFGRRDNPWRVGEHMTIAKAESGETMDRNFYLVLASTLSSLPLGLKPFGRSRGTLSLLETDAPPKWLPVTTPAVLMGKEGGWLARAGYRHHHDSDAYEIETEGGFILDGEAYPAGALTLKAGDPVHFAVP